MSVLPLQGASWTAVNSTVGTDIIFTESDDPVVAGIDEVQVKIKRTLAVGEKLFTRLKVTVTP